MTDQGKLLLGYLQTHGSITAMQALNDLGIMRLSARIYDLRADGYDISLEMKSGQNRFGKNISYGVYRLEAAPDEAGQLCIL